MRDDVLVVEISGKRAGTKQQRPTEKLPITYPHLIISNNSEGYVSEWDIVNVPDDYREWYVQNVKQSESAWYAPMNRSYAIKYAREQGYRYLVQMDDNIQTLELAIRRRKNGIQSTFSVQNNAMADDFITALILALENSNAAQAGMVLMSVQPETIRIAERYCYSFFALDLERCPDVFQGDFEDDIEYRLKGRQMGVGSIALCPLRYNKTSQGNNKDLTGCRKAYAEAGVKRGENMRTLYGDVYTCGTTSKRQSTMGEAVEGVTYFKHKLHPFKVGVTVNEEPILEYIAELARKYAKEQKSRYYIRKHKVKNGKNGKAAKGDKPEAV